VHKNNNSNSLHDFILTKGEKLTNLVVSDKKNKGWVNRFTIRNPKWVAVSQTNDFVGNETSNIFQYQPFVIAFANRIFYLDKLKIAISALAPNLAGKILVPTPFET